MNIANETWFWPLALVFLGWAVLSFFALARDKRDLEWLGSHRFLLSPRMVWGRRIVKGVLALSAFLLLLLGAARLQGKPVPEEVSLRGSDVMIVLDLSKSMMSQDLMPNRLEAGKRAVEAWLSNGEGNRAGLVVFAGEALLQVPLTLDLEAVSLVLDKDDTEVVDRGGTDIGKAIRAALSAFPKEEGDKRGKAILLITDGEVTDGASNLTQACLEAQERKIPIVAVGMGTRQGRYVPAGVSFWGDPAYKRDRSGNLHISRLDEAALQKMADMTQGTFIHGDTDEGLASIQKALGRLETTQMKGRTAIRRREMAPGLGAGAAGVLLLASLI